MVGKLRPQPVTPLRLTNYNMSDNPMRMIVNVRTFLRDFSALKARARKGETVRVKDKGGEFLFTAYGPLKIPPRYSRLSLGGDRRGSPKQQGSACHRDDTLRAIGHRRYHLPGNR